MRRGHPHKGDTLPHVLPPCDLRSLHPPLLPDNSWTAFDAVHANNTELWTFDISTLSPPFPLRLYILPYWSNPPFLIFDIRTLWRTVLSARVPECQKLKNGGSDQYDAEPFEHQQFRTADVKGANSRQVFYSTCDMAQRSNLWFRWQGRVRGSEELDRRWQPRLHTFLHRSWRWQGTNHSKIRRSLRVLRPSSSLSLCRQPRVPSAHLPSPGKRWWRHDPPTR